jgi:glucoamylase
VALFEGAGLSCQKTKKTCARRRVGGTISLALATVSKVDDLDEWLATEENIAIRHMLANISPPGATAGAVIASPSRVHPDYFYHWVRDAAGVARTLVQLYQLSQDADSLSKYLTMLAELGAFDWLIQRAQTPSKGVGEPKFLVNGQAFKGNWARPQNDAPASRAIVLIGWANILLDEGQPDFVHRVLYNGLIPTNSVIKTDLEYTANHWQETSFDVWEEVRGHHFYTRILERRALMDGARLASRLDDENAARWYARQAEFLTVELENHWDSVRGYLVPTRNQDDGTTYKTSELDSSIILGVLLGRTGNGVFALTDDRVLATISALNRRFANLYAINQRDDIGTAIGRYPEDRYDGYQPDSVGNPWVLTTAAFAQFYFRLLRQYVLNESFTITARSQNFFSDLGTPYGVLMPGIYQHDDPRFDSVIQALQLKGDGYLERIRLHTNPDGSLSEQINRDTGFLQGAPHLSLSYATFLWAAWARRGQFPEV